MSNISKELESKELEIKNTVLEMNNTFDGAYQ